jgi:hypothetical protein
VAQVSKLVPQVINSGGPVMSSPRVVPVTFMADATAADAVTFIEQLAGSPYWSAVTAEYGVGPLVAAPALQLEETPPAVESQQVVEDWLRSKLMSASGFPQPTDETIYAVFNPNGPIEAPLGFHGAFALPNGSIVSYAVLRTNAPIDTITSNASHELAEAATDPRPSTRPAWSDLDVDHRGWELLGNAGSGFAGRSGGEIGDVCPVLIQPWRYPVNMPPPSLLPPWSVPRVSVTGIDHEVQRVWSNRAALEKHDPCVPFGLSPYFNAAAVPPDVVTATDFAGNHFTTRGVHLPVGQTRTIELDLYSDIPTEPWSLAVQDETSYDLTCQVSIPALPPPFPLDAMAPDNMLPPPPSVPASSSVSPPQCSDPTVAISLDKDAGKDGDKIQLTLTQRASALNGTHFLVIANTLGEAQTVWPLIVQE